MPVGLDQLVAAARSRAASSKTADRRSKYMEMAARHQPRGFAAALRHAAKAGPAIIAELKKASPSRGLIRGSFHVSVYAAELQDAGAAALSVLTEEEHFQGSLANLAEASVAATLPCLRKDFIVDDFQILEARAYGADAVLLIAAALSDAELKKLLASGREMGLDVLCEVHDEAELTRALDAGCDVIGVNNRDLRTLQVDLNTAIRLGPKLPGSALRVAESGIQSAADLRTVRAAGYDAFLIGESLMKAESPGEALKELLASAAMGKHGLVV